ncbi:MAG TPA: hypothetical protein VI873_01480 [Candidatus Peribacteraceae bacterium]|nr:hypothetical protein [Candidatus Peribacteraceae bacterium]
MTRTMTKEKADLITRLEGFPNPNTIWSAFRAEMITEETVRYLLRDRRNWRQKIVDTAFGDNPRDL